MSQDLKKGARVYAQNINKQAKSINACAIITISADVPASVLPYVEKSGAPVGEICTSNTKKTAFFRSFVLPFYPSTLARPLSDGAKWEAVAFTTNKERAQAFTENSASVESFRNCGELVQEFGKATGEHGALRSVYFYRIRKELRDVVLQDNGAAGKVFKVDEKTGKRAKEVHEVREYVCARGGVYTLQEARQYYFEALGVPAAIAAEAEQEAAEKAAAAVMRAEQAKARAEAAAVKALENAKKLQAAAAAKAEAAEQEQSAQGMTAAEAQKIEQAKAEAKAAKEAEKTENESRKKGELSKKPCKNTMKQAANELHNYERVQK